MTYPLNEKEPDALVIMCSDYRFQEAFQLFLREELGIHRPMIIAIPGSISSIGVTVALPKSWHSMRNYIETLTGVHTVSRVVVINHDNCKGYAKLASLLGGMAKIPDAQRKHLQQMAMFVKKEYLPNANTELYQARIVEKNGERVVEFEKVL
jgi:carbonic anhydrase